MSTKRKRGKRGGRVRPEGVTCGVCGVRIPVERIEAEAVLVAIEGVGVVDVVHQVVCHEVYRLRTAESIGDLGVVRRETLQRLASRVGGSDA